MRKHPINSINLEIVSFETFRVSDDNMGFTIGWCSDIGFGEYIVYKTKDGFAGDSERMDWDDNKEFITELMRLFIEKLKIEG